MSFSLIGLIYFQYRWIDNVLEANEDKFHIEVQETLLHVSEKIERGEVYKLANRQLNPLKATYSNGSFISIDNAGGATKLFDSLQGIEFFYADFIAEFEKLNKERGLGFDLSLNKQELTAVINQEGFYFRFGQGRMKSDTNYRRSKKEEMLSKLFQKQHMVQKVVRDIFDPRKKIDSRINNKEIDSLLRDELSSRGINLKYDFAVYDGENRKVVLTNTSHPQDLINSSYRARLFPNDFLNNSDWLMISFPSQNRYFLKQIWVTLLSSGLLVLIISYCFGYAIYVILKQKKLSEIKNDFINNMTHEFKTPIATISLAHQALKDSDVIKEPGFRDRYLNIIGEENKRLELQVEKVLQTALMERKRLEVKYEQVDVHDIINKAIQNIQLQVEQKNGIIKKDLKAEKVDVQADRVHMTNIIYNLLDNANKYSKEIPDITVESESNNFGVVIKVKDQGVGMSKETVKRIFEKFYRVPTGNVHDVKGFGLGLAYVKTIVDLHEGRIEVDSEVNIGTTFEIQIPYAQKS